MKIGIIRERKQPSDQRVPLTPNQCAIIRERYPEVDLVVETSPDRCYADDEYREQGVTVTDDLSSCDVLMGVKEVPIDHLLAGKTYFFFSHTIKEQPYNRNLLRTVLERNIRLVDYETLTATTGQRLIGFGRYAGIVGAYNGVRAWGLRHGTFQLPKAVDCRDRQEMETGFDQVQLPAIKIALSGGGRVARGAMEVLDALQVPKVSPEAFLNEAFDGAVYTQLNVLDYNARLDGTPGVVQDFFTHPEAYRSDFFRFAKVADFFIAWHYWDAAAPFLFTREDARQPDFRIKVVADISCDIDGPVASTIRPSTIADPIYGYNPQTETEGDFQQDSNLTVMAVDNLPCELPRDASEDFGAELLGHILPALLGDDSETIIERATIARGGALTPLFHYLQDYVNG